MQVSDENAVDTVQYGDMELLLFYLGERCFGIDITMVKEVIPRPDMTQVPHSHPAVCGVFHLRGAPLTVVDLQQATGSGAVPEGESGSGSVIVTEFFSSRQGILVSRVDRIIHCKGDDFSESPSSMGDSHYISQVARHGDELIQVLDFERILAGILPKQAVADAAA